MTALSTPAPPRHVLVVGAQCHGSENLQGLEGAARHLHKALVDPDLGACLGRGEGETGSLLVGTALGKGRVETALAVAADKAKEDGGPLILALIGHGMGGYGGPMHFVTTGSMRDGAIRQLDVASAIGTVANEPGINGLIAIVDTCYAAGALPSAQAVTAGLQQGNLRLSLLFAASAHLPARDMNLSSQLATLMESGLPDAGDLLELDDRLIKELRSRITTQEPSGCSFNGTPLPGGSLWLSHNVGSVTRRAASSIGSLAHERMRKVLGPLDETGSVNTQEQLADWLDQLEAGRRSHPAVRRVLWFQDDLRICQSTVKALEESFGRSLTDDLLRKAAARTPFPLEVVTRMPCPSLRDLVEHAVLLESAADPHRRFRALAHFVAALTHLMCPRANLPEQLAAWASNLGVSAALNGRHTDLAHETPRLVLVAADDGGEEIIRVDASLLFGSAVVHARTFPCGRGSDALESTLDKAVGWALLWLNAAGEQLVPIDLSVPTLWLLDAPPEEWRVVRGRRMLGVDYDVTTRWSGLLTPPPGIRLDDMLHTGRQLLSSLQSSPHKGPSWLSSDHLRSFKTLQELLGHRRTGACVWGVSTLPDNDFDLMMEELLIHTPALIWPRHKDVADTRTLHAAVAEHWDSLPEKLALAFQGRLAGYHDAGVPSSLADIRATWHDEHWQTFCQRRAGRAVVAPQDVTPKEQA
ncbi:hypothetical protein AB0O76_17860 [Streptomyces sp. NPDC086554]|uniref:vWA-MoxR associated conflict system protein n=1 Tax=Streptomyces sp. NPDC086554 TaxID=3154864 RepID=UPI0034262018